MSYCPNPKLAIIFIQGFYPSPCKDSIIGLARGQTWLACANMRPRPRAGSQGPYDPSLTRTGPV